MNIFATDQCPHNSAMVLPDKHIVKMPLESCQMLSIIYSKWYYNWGTLPKADGTVWGQHSRDDLIPLGSIGNAVNYAKGILNRNHTHEVIGTLLGFKIMDEASGKNLLFKITEDEKNEIHFRLFTMAYNIIYYLK